MRSLLARTRDWLGTRVHRLDILAILIVSLGGLLRFYRSTELSLWLDEGFTLAFARLPWDQVLGLRGAYDGMHPPLYASVVKAVTLVVPELDAGRYLSVVAGTATLAVLYLLVVRIAGRPAALVACLIAAISPLLSHSGGARRRDRALRRHDFRPGGRPRAGAALRHVDLQRAVGGAAHEAGAE